MRYTLASIAQPAVIEEETGRTSRRMEAAATIGGGIFTAISLVMFATNRAQAGYTMGVLGALSAAIVGGIRIYAD